jgi:AcrR family transcriptional regulator
MNNILQRAEKKYRKYKARHQNILDAAVGVFNAKGYKGATIAEISDEAKVFEAIIYRHFQDKKRLFIKCFESVSNELFAGYRRVYKKYRHDEITYLEEVTKFWVNWVLGNPHKVMFLVHMLSYKGDADFFSMFERFMRMCAEGIRRILKSAKAKGKLKSTLDIEFLAMAYVNQHFTVIAMKELLEPEYLTEDAFVQLMKNLLCID